MTPYNETYIDYMPRYNVHGRPSFNSLHEAANGDIWLWGNDGGGEGHGACVSAKPAKVRVGSIP